MTFLYCGQLVQSKKNILLAVSVGAFLEINKTFLLEYASYDWYSVLIVWPLTIPEFVYFSGIWFGKKHLSLFCDTTLIFDQKSVILYSLPYGLISCKEMMLSNQIHRIMSPPWTALVTSSKSRKCWVYCLTPKKHQKENVVGVELFLAPPSIVHSCM